jgi:hypothetical protein
VTIKSITLAPESLRFSDTATITVVLTGPAPAPGLDVRMSFTSPVVFGLPVALHTLPIASGSSDGQISVKFRYSGESRWNGPSPPGTSRSARRRSSDKDSYSLVCLTRVILLP